MKTKIKTYNYIESIAKFSLGQTVYSNRSKSINTDPLIIGMIVILSDTKPIIIKDEKLHGYDRKRVESHLKALLEHYTYNSFDDILDNVCYIFTNDTNWLWQAEKFLSATIPL